MAMELVCRGKSNLNRMCVAVYDRVFSRTSWELFMSFLGGLLCMHFLETALR
jgi:hypothetical protein